MYEHTYQRYLDIQGGPTPIDLQKKIEELLENDDDQLIQLEGIREDTEEIQDKIHRIESENMKLNGEIRKWKQANDLVLSKLDTLDKTDQEILDQIKTLSDSDKRIEAEVKKLGQNDQEIMESIKRLSEKEDEILQKADLIQENQLKMQEMQSELENNQKKMIDTLGTLSSTVANLYKNLTTDNREIIKKVVQIEGAQRLMNGNLVHISKQIKANEKSLTLSIEAGNYVNRYELQIGRLYQTIDDFEEIRRDKTGRFIVDGNMDRFKESSEKVYNDIDAVFRMLEGTDDYILGGSIFKALPETCDPHFLYKYLNLIDHSIDLYKEGARMRGNQTTKDDFDRRWYKHKANATGEYYRYCGCSIGQSFQVRGVLSELFDKLEDEDEKDWVISIQSFLAISLISLKSSHLQGYCDAIKNISVLPIDSYQREKVTLLQNVRSFKVNSKTLNVLKHYWLEDIKMVAHLHKEKSLDLLDLLNEVGTCVALHKNPGIKLQKGSICGIAGICEVNNQRRKLSTLKKGFFYSISGNSSWDEKIFHE